MDSKVSYLKVTDCKDWSVLHITPLEQKNDKKDLSLGDNLKPRPKTPNLQGNNSKSLKLNKIKLAKKNNATMSNDDLKKFKNSKKEG